MLEWHQLLEIDGKHAEEDGVAEGAHKGRCIESFDIQFGCDVEVHHHLISQHQRKTDGEQLCVLQAQHLHPPQTEQTATDGTYPAHDVEPRRGEHAIVQNAPRKHTLQRVVGGVHPLLNHEEKQDGG